MEGSKIGKERVKEIVEDALSEPRLQEYESAGSTGRPKDWKDLQVKVKEIYSNLGCQAEENVIVGGGKTKHQIDVLATFQFGGQNYRIIIDCKHWSSRVKKSQVSSLIGVLADIGAEKGIIVSKMGFQRGAYKLAAYTNIEAKAS
jgi:predicted Mrr-cat superfamily restriction endonuclease